MKTKRFTFIGFLLVALAACTEQVKVEPFTYPEVFTGKTKQGWTIRSVQLLQQGKGTITFNLSQCVTDDLYIFYNNPERTYQVTDGATKCNASDPNLIVDSSWSFTNSTAALTIIVPILSDSPLPFIVKEVDNSKLVIDIYFDDNKSNYRINFKTAQVE